MKKVFYTLAAIIGSVGLTGWVMTTYRGGMFINLISYFPLLILIFIIFGISIIETIHSITNDGVKRNKHKIIILLIPVIVFFATCLYDSELFKAKKVLSAILIDDLSSSTLTFREDGSYDYETLGLFGYQDISKGKYYFKGDTIVFTKKPYDNNFIPDTILIDREEAKLFLKKDSLGHFNRKTEYATYFDIIE